jgi:serine/threonine protein kinase
VKGISELHKRKIVHRDIKPDNILIHGDGTIKICDFGISKRIHGKGLISETSGTPAFMAPETFSNKWYEPYSADIWSLGVLLYTLLSGTNPFKNDDIKIMKAKIATGEYKVIEDISDEAKDLILKLLQPDPSKRILNLVRLDNSDA